MSHRILITGSIAYDLLLQYTGNFRDGIPRESHNPLALSFVTHDYKRHCGGTGTNIAWGLRLLGADPLLVSSIGHDGHDVLRLLKEQGIDTTYIEQFPKHHSATAIIASDTNEEQITFFHPGADAEGQWPETIDAREIAWAIAAPREERLMMACLEFCHHEKIPVLFDPGQQLLSFGEESLHRATMLATGMIANTAEWITLCHRLGSTQESFLRHCEFLVETKGADGLSILTAEECIDIPAVPVQKVIDPTGAGDALRAGFLAGLSQGLSLRASGELGAKMGHLAVMQEGTLLKSIENLMDV